VGEDVTTHLPPIVPPWVPVLVSGNLVSLANDTQPAGR
jgi:hypothetical protein